jgi:uncharacterized membrane protein
MKSFVEYSTVFLLVVFLVVFIFVFFHLVKSSNEMSMLELEREAMKDAKNHTSTKKHIDSH